MSLSNLTEVVVRHWSSVKLTEGLQGICSSFFPQYLTKAILLGADHFVWNEEITFGSPFGKSC
jgi:hypothetical protein